MKRIFAIALAITILMSLSTTAFATQVDLGYVGEETKIYTDSSNIDVFAKYSATSDGVGVISVDIEYEAMKFVYVNDTSKGVWNPDKHEFENDTTLQRGWVAVGGTDKSGNQITVTNHSNVIVWVDVASELDITGVTMKFTNKEDKSDWKVTDLESALDKAYEKADSVAIMSILDGDINENTLSGTADKNGFFNVGDLTVTIYGDDPAATTNP